MSIAAAAASITLVRIAALVAGTTDGTWTPPVWESLMVVLLVSAAALAIASYLARSSRPPSRAEAHAPDPPLLRFLFGDTRTAPFWLAVRLYAGFIWFQAGYGKVVGTEGDWMSGGTALRGRCLGASVTAIGR